MPGLPIPRYLEKVLFFSAAWSCLALFFWAFFLISVSLTTIAPFGVEENTNSRLYGFKQTSISI
jgi:hypothetical protein